MKRRARILAAIITILPAMLPCAFPGECLGAGAADSPYRLHARREAWIGVAAALIGASLLLMTGGAAREDWSAVAVMYIETIAFAASAASCAKGSVERIRPFVYNPEVPMHIRCTEEPRRSFFSRHASIAFASAVILSTVHDAYRPDSRGRPYVWGISILAAAGVGIARVEAGAHFPTDVLAGAVAGSAIGYLVPHLHRAGGREAALVPVFRGGGAGLAIEIGLQAPAP